MFHWFVNGRRFGLTPSSSLLCVRGALIHEACTFVDDLGPPLFSQRNTLVATIYGDNFREGAFQTVCVEINEDVEVRRGEMDARETLSSSCEVSK